MNAICYAHLNMVRADVVKHPRDWRWCGHDEMTGTRKRYRILDLERLADTLGMATVDEVREAYREVLETRLASERLQREPACTEALAVGDEEFVRGVARQYMRRVRLRIEQIEQTTGDLDGAWMVREPEPP